MVLGAAVAVPEGEDAGLAGVGPRLGDARLLAAFADRRGVNEIYYYYLLSIKRTLVRLPRQVCVAGVAGADVGGAAGPANLATVVTLNT